MSQRQISIADMQCWVFHHAQRKWNLAPAECAVLFRRFDLLGYISECYDLLHVSSYQCALKDIEDLLRSKGGCMIRLPADGVLYHGSYTKISSIDLSRCRPGLDFLKGFYLTSSYSQALSYVFCRRSQSTAERMDPRSVSRAGRTGFRLCLVTGSEPVYPHL